ncbi:MAG: membrane protein insertion efficiency factor YidD [Planctomycetaceae bacterium]
MWFFQPETRSPVRETVEKTVHTEPHETENFRDDDRPAASAEPSRRRSVWQRVTSIPAFLLIGLVKLYQWSLSPIFGGQCRFYPSCSNYFIQAVQKYGVISGSIRGVARILRCHPFHRGGYDPP